LNNHVTKEERQQKKKDNKGRKTTKEERQHGFTFYCEIVILDVLWKCYLQDI
jgi:hypothetical protein